MAGATMGAAMAEATTIEPDARKPLRPPHRIQTKNIQPHKPIMKNIPALALVAVLSTVAVASSFADSPAATPDEASWQQKALDYRLSYLTDKLNLTPDQQAKVKPILQKEIDREIVLHHKTRQQLNEVLTPDQQTALENLHHPKLNP